MKWMAAAVVLLALYGLVRLLLWACVRLLAGEEQGIWLLPLAGHAENIELYLRFARTVNLCGARPHIWLVDAGLDEASRTLAQQIAARQESVSLLTVPDAEKLLQSGLHSDESLL